MPSGIDEFDRTHYSFNKKILLILSLGCLSKSRGPYFSLFDEILLFLEVKNGGSKKSDEYKDHGNEEGP